MVSNDQLTNNVRSITVFGSAMMRVPPNVARINFSISRSSMEPKVAFSETNQATGEVMAYLQQGSGLQVAKSHMTLNTEFRYNGQKQEFVGYKASTRFDVLLTDLTQIQEVLVGIVDAGVNNIERTQYDTTHLKELRAAVRRQAVEAARAKADLYCESAGVQVGDVLQIEDVDPNRLMGRESHVTQTIPDDADAELKAIDPGSIVVTGAVQITYALENNLSV